MRPEPMFTTRLRLVAFVAVCSLLYGLESVAFRDRPFSDGVIGGAISVIGGLALVTLGARWFERWRKSDEKGR